MQAPRAHRPERQRPVRAVPDPTAGEPADVRSATPPLFRSSHLAPLARRLLSICTLAAIDIAGLTGGLLATLVLREVYYGRSPQWSALWDAAGNWLAFLILITLLVFAQGNLYAERERRPGTGRVVSSLLLVVLIALAFGLGTGHRFSP